VSGKPFNDHAGGVSDMISDGVRHDGCTVGATMTSRYVFDRAPARIYWELTRACDLACRHCRAEAAAQRDPRELSPEESLAVIERLAAFGSPAPHLVLTGGDPLKRPDLFQLIEHGQRAGLNVAVAPSATPLLTPEVIVRFKAAGVEAISLSVDGASAQTHDALRGFPGCFERTRSIAQAAVNAGLPFQANTLVSQETVGQLAAIGQLVSDWGASRWSLFMLIAVGRGAVLQPIGAGSCELLFDWISDLKLPGTPVITTTEAPHYRRVLLEKLGASAASMPGAGMRDGNGVMFISHTGEIQPSGFLPIVAGNVREHDPVAIYRESALFRSLRRPELFGDQCGQCDYRHICGGSRARAFAATGDPLGHDPLCAHEPTRLRRASRA
jgi:AdoMet-dependent heme synthase